MSDPVSLHVEFGPIEPFIAEARRTRDSWAGSYILSYLMAQALVAAEAAGATIVYPAVDQDLLVQAVRALNERKPLPDLGTANRVGSLPDRFEASAANTEEAQKIAVAGAKGWRRAWVGLAGEVWKYLNEKAWQGRGSPATKSQWDRQIGTEDGGGPWSIRWTIGAYERHLWRWALYPFHQEKPDQGEMSTLGGGREALRGDQTDRRAVSRFWEETASRIPGYELRTGGTERLDAVGTVKRFLPYVAENKEALGWKVQTSYPSTRTIAAAPWLRSLFLEVDPPDLGNLIGDLTDALEWAGARPLNFYEPNPELAKLAAESKTPKDAEKLIKFDGEIYFPEIAEAWEGLDPDGTQFAKEAIRALIREGDKHEIRSPRHFFALLAMDGDHLGDLLKFHPASKVDLAQALGRFSEGVPQIVESGDLLGQAIYAGGDDVLALLPVEGALTAADRVRRWYEETLAGLAKDEPLWRPTISAAVIYAHVADPLRQVVHRAHGLLEGIAKHPRELGRDAFAVEVWKGGGPTLTVGRPWQTQAPANGSEDQTTDWPEEIHWAAKELADDRFSDRLFYRLQSIIDVVEHGGRQGLSAEQQEEILLAEHLKTRREDEPDLAEERKRISRLCDLLRRRTNAEDPQHQSGTLEWPMARFIRFLVEREE